MLHHIDVRNTKIAAGLLTLTLGNPANGYVVKEIEGLDPVKANLISSSFAGLDGERYHGGRREVRNVRISLQLKHPSIPVSVLRRRLYQVLMPESEVAMSFYDADGTYLNINGVVETAEGSFFVKEPSMIISILCYDPDFMAPTPGAVSAAVSQGDPIAVDYAGTVPSGIVYQMNVLGPMPRVILTLAPPGHPDQYFWVNTPMNAGDSLFINTAPGERAVRIQRAGAPASISAMFAVWHESVWLQLQPGINNFRAWSDNLNSSYTLSWWIRHGGL